MWMKEMMEREEERKEEERWEVETGSERRDRQDTRICLPI